MGLTTWLARKGSPEQQREASTETLDAERQEVQLLEGLEQSCLVSAPDIQSSRGLEEAGVAHEI